ncbi:MAG TPA: hypothetical protein VNR65_17465, partial [Geobacterales bacterium]|nr:hypothetical protein [Geobacterales bacterium]
MLEFIFLGFFFLTILVFALAYWPKKAKTRAPAPGATDGAPPKGAPARAVQTAPSSRRVALVIGNGAYTSVDRLKNPANDASAVAG